MAEAHREGVREGENCNGHQPRSLQQKGLCPIRCPNAHRFRNINLRTVTEGTRCIEQVIISSSSHLYGGTEKHLMLPQKGSGNFIASDATSASAVLFRRGERVCLASETQTYKDRSRDTHRVPVLAKGHTHRLGKQHSMTQ